MDSVENTHTLKITTILTGSENYPLWKRQMEQALSAKRRLGYVTGKVTKPKEDEEKIETWTMANNQVITWILQNLNRESYEVTQNERTIEEYYTELQMIWDELENMSSLPAINKITTEMAEYLKAVATQVEEMKLFQFLNGLDKSYGILRSNILLMDPLPSVEHTVSLMLQEEMQTNNVGGSRQSENSTLMSKGEAEREKCTHCGRDNHREWIIDSGVTNHMVSKLSMLNNVRELGNKLKINLPDGRCVKVTHKGDILLDNGLKLADMLFVPEFKQNLLSVQMLAKDNICYGCEDGKIKGLGKVDSGHTRMATDTVCRPDNNEELGHAPLSSLKHLSMLHLHHLNDTVCLTCPMAKLTKSSFPNRQTNASNPFDLIHMDIWGPYRVAYKGKYKYFLTIVDDNSRATWVYLLCHKSDTLDHLKTFYEYARTQFYKRIKIVRSDNALDFDDQFCRKFFEENGIIHQTSIVDRPQQNGVTPYEIIHHKPANYSDLKVFGCLVMVYNPDRDRDKFQPRGIPCVFLGYPANKKRYKVQDLMTKRRFVSRDVKFYEQILPFSQNSQGVHMTLRSIGVLPDQEYTEMVIDEVEGGDQTAEGPQQKIQNVTPDESELEHIETHSLESSVIDQDNAADITQSI
ncbi:hypothetical protein RND81_07G163400 [Saponaria officinalis]|uniref:Integrase catalytic domain-containing protein n=1 Tax=Saponaria officinalis TaxID=3572 RepID=A0AAW1JT36_SAPOF